MIDAFLIRCGPFLLPNHKGACHAQGVSPWYRLPVHPAKMAAVGARWRAYCGAACGVVGNVRDIVNG